MATCERSPTLKNLKKLFLVFVAKKLFLIIVLLSFSSHAGPPSVLGGKPMDTDTVHNVGLGWPSVFYEWWHSGNPDWAIGGELVYGDWSGDFTDVEIGFALNAPFRWQLRNQGITDIALRVAPGAIIGSVEAVGSDLLLGGVRADVGLPISVAVDDKFNIITGGTLPLTLIFLESADPYFVVPLMARIGFEVQATETIAPSLLFEAGPAIAIGDFGTEVDFAIRAWFGSIFF